MFSVVINLHFPAAGSDIHRFLHGTGNLSFVRIEYNMTIGVSRSTADYLDERLGRTEKSLFMGVNNTDK